MKDSGIAAAIAKAKTKIDEPKYIEGNNSYLVYYHKENNGKITWAAKTFLKKEDANEFYLKKLHEFMYELSMPFYRLYKLKGR